MAAWCPSTRVRRALPVSPRRAHSDEIDFLLTDLLPSHFVDLSDLDPIKYSLAKVAEQCKSLGIKMHDSVWIVIKEILCRETVLRQIESNTLDILTPQRRSALVQYLSRRFKQNEKTTTASASAKVSTFPFLILPIFRSYENEWISLENRGSASSSSSSSTIRIPPDPESIPSFLTDNDLLDRRVLKFEGGDEREMVTTISRNNRPQIASISLTEMYSTYVFSHTAWTGGRFPLDSAFDTFIIREVIGLATRGPD